MNDLYKDKKNIILQVDNLKKYFNVKKNIFSAKKECVKAVDEVSFNIQSGEILGLIGESGCGKTTLVKTILGLLKPTSGAVFFKGQKISSLTQNQIRLLRSKIQIIFQDPYSSLNPKISVGDVLYEVLKVHGVVSRKEIKSQIYRLLDMVGLPKNSFSKYPHEFSGGQRQRIGIARALAVDPEFIVCDEVVSALDVSVQAQILNLLIELREERNLTLLFISHDLSVVEYISDRIAVMYLGKIIEMLDTKKIYSDSIHPYTASLISSIPSLNISKKNNRLVLQDDISNSIKISSGCSFFTKCPIANKDNIPIQKCIDVSPVLLEKKDSHFVSCHQY